MSEKNKVEFNAPHYEPNLSYFETVMNNIRLIDNSAAGAEGYTRPDMPLLVDLLVSKILNDEKRNEIIEYQEKMLKEGKENNPDNLPGEHDETVMRVCVEVYQKCVSYYGKYLTWETRLAVMKS